MITATEQSRSGVFSLASLIDRIYAFNKLFSFDRIAVSWQSTLSVQFSLILLMEQCSTLIVDLNYRMQIN